MRLTLSKARAYVDKGIQEARAKKKRVSVAVIDEFGHVIQLDRMDGALLMSADLAEAKAVTALQFKRSTSEVAEFFRRNAELLRSCQEVVKFKILPLAGGLPIFESGVLVGAIGVSGEEPDEDEEIAKQAIV